MAIKVSKIPNLDHVSNVNTPLSNSSQSFRQCEGDGNEEDDLGYKFPKFVVMGHRGSGMNMLQSDDKRMKSIKENTILSFNSASRLPLDFLEFDVQVTKDDCPIIFHDIFLYTKDKGSIAEKRVTDLNLQEFLSYGPQKETTKIEKPLLRKTKDGRIFEWMVEQDAPFCTLEEAFTKVNKNVKFNIELKFDDQIQYDEERLVRVLRAILRVVSDHAKDRAVVFSSFQPDAAQLMRKLQSAYPVFFLTNGGSEIYKDVRRNSLDAAIRVCVEGNLQGIVAEVKAIFRNPDAVPRIKEYKLSLITYGQLNNVSEVVYAQMLMGVEGIIIDLVEEIAEAVSDFRGGQATLSLAIEELEMKVKSIAPELPHDTVLFLHKLIPQPVES